jgi:hypothetical protein
MADRITDLSVAELLGDPYAPEGSRLWSIFMRDEIHRLLHQQETDHGSLQRCVDAFTRHEGWRTLQDPGGRTFTTYSQFCKAKWPHGLGRRAEEIDTLFKEGAAKRSGQALAADENVGPLFEHGGDRKEQGNNVTLPERGNKAEYLVRRLKRDRPDIAADLAAGKYPSARAAAIAAGIVTVPTPLEQVLRLLPKLSRADLETVAEEIGRTQKGD